MDRYVSAAFRGVIGDLRKVTGEGDRNNQLNNAAYRLGRFIPTGLDESVARAWLEDTARAIGLDEGEIARTVQSGLEAGKREPFVLDGRNDYRPAAELEQADPSEIPEPLDWATILADTTPEIDWLIPEIIERGRLHALFAPSKTHKSLIVQYLCAELASRAVVMYLDFENTTMDLRIRFRDMEHTAETLANLKYWVFPPMSALDTLAGGAQLMSWVDKFEPALVIIDTTSRVIRGGENDSDTFRALYNYSLRQLKAKGVAVLRIDHAGKDVALGQRGSSAKGDDVDTVWLLIKHDEERFTLKCQLQRSGHHPEIINLRKALDPLRFERLESEESTGPLGTDAIIRELERLRVTPDTGYKPAFELLRNSGKNVRRAMVQSAMTEWRRRVDADALTLDQLPEQAGPNPGPKINSQDHVQPDRQPDRIRTEKAEIAAQTPDQKGGPSKTGLVQGVQEGTGPSIGGAVSPPMVRPPDTGPADGPKRPAYVDKVERAAMDALVKGGIGIKITDA
jgi:hypothetical protein